MLPYLIYLPTLIYVPHAVFLFAIVFAIVRKRNIKRKHLFNSLSLTILVITLLSAINFAFHLDANKASFELIPYALLMVGSYIIAIRLTNNDLRIIIYLILLETIIAFAEFILGVKTFFPGSEIDNTIKDSALLYFRSVYGLSDNSSSFAIKILLAYLLIHYLEWEGVKANLIKIIFLVGLVISFNRTSIVAVVIFHALQYGGFLWKSWQQLFIQFRISKRLASFLILGFLLIITIVYLIWVNYDMVFEQLTRRTQHFEITGRDVVWSKYLEFISSNILFGNGSHKYFVEYLDGGQYHAHNSYLQVLASNGLIIFTFYISMILLRIRRNNLVFVVPLLIYSLAQYGIFWGISLTDILLLLFLLRDRMQDEGDQPKSLTVI